jgi:hypothetical protein
MPTFADGGCHVVSVTDSYGRILGFLDKTIEVLLRRNSGFGLGKSSSNRQIILFVTNLM